METEQRECPDCGEVEHGHLGFVPTILFKVEADGGYSDVWVCLTCGQAELVRPDKDAVREAEEEYGEMLQEAGVISEEEKTEMLQ